jgi:hypothetical protein
MGQVPDYRCLRDRLSESSARILKQLCGWKISGIVLHQRTTGSSADLQCLVGSDLIAVRLLICFTDHECFKRLCSRQPKQSTRLTGASPSLASPVSIIHSCRVEASPLHISRCNSLSHFMRAVDVQKGYAALLCAIEGNNRKWLSTILQ